MFGSTSLEAPPVYGNLGTGIVEQIRSNHEEIEKLEQLVMEVLKTEEPSPMKKLLQGHRLRSITKSIILKAEKLVDTYKNNDVAVKDERLPIREPTASWTYQFGLFRYPLKNARAMIGGIAPLPDQTATWTNASIAYFDRLQEILEYHRSHPSVCLVIADDDYEALLKENEPVIRFSGEESFGRYLDLHIMHNQYINSNFGARVEYSTYLDVFSQPENIPSQLTLSRQYTEYLEALLEYLIYFFQRTEPLQDLDRILYKVVTNFEEQYAQVEPEKLTALQLLEKKLSLMEVKVKKLCNLLDETIKRTKQKGDKTKALAFDEMEEEKAHTESESGWLGMPIPYWPYKLGLGQEYKCEICTECYWGKKAFERHLETWRHKDGLSCLEIQGTEKFNEEAKQVWKRRIPKRQKHETEEHNSSQAPLGVAIPPPEIKIMIEKTARFLAKEELEVEKRIVATYGEDHSSFKFLKSSDPYHLFYQHKITEYRGAQATTDPDATHIQSDAHSGYDVSFRPTLETDKFTCRVPEGITAKELDIIKLTAEFWARFGRCFWEGFKERVMKDPEFEFIMNPRDHRFSLFEGLVQAYSKIFRPSENPIDKLRRKTADMETVVENCLHRLQWDCFQKKRMEKRVKMVMVNETLSPRQLAALSGMMNMARRPPQPQPKREKVEESDLIPENEFIAQHPGRGIMRITIPHANDAYIEVVVPSLLENVAKLKERIALHIQLPASKQKLSGKTGVLKDDMSLAYYNVGPRDFLTLSKFI